MSLPFQSLPFGRVWCKKKKKSHLDVTSHSVECAKEPIPQKPIYSLEGEPLRLWRIHSCSDSCQIVDIQSYDILSLPPLFLRQERQSLDRFEE